MWRVIRVHPDISTHFDKLAVPIFGMCFFFLLPRTLILGKSTPCHSYAPQLLAMALIYQLVLGHSFPKCMWPYLLTLSTMKKDTPTDFDLENITPTQSRVGEVLNHKVVQEDAVFGEIQEGDTNYRDVGNCNDSSPSLC